MTTQLTISLRDLLGHPIGAGRDVDGEVSVAYSREVPLVSGEVLEPVPHRKPLPGTGIVTFDVVAADDVSVVEAHQHFALEVRWIISYRGARGIRQELRGSRTVKVVEEHGAEVIFGELLPAEPLPPMWTSVADLAADMDATQAAAERAADSSAQAAAAAASSAGLVGAPPEETVQTVTARAMLAESAAAALRAVTDEVGIQVVSLTRLRFHARVAENQVWAQDLYRVPAGSVVGPVAPTPFILDAATLTTTTPAPPNTLGPPAWVDETDQSVVHTGSTVQWQQPTAQAAAYGGGYRYTDTAGDYVTYAAPASVAVWVRTPLVVNGGYGLVRIDGSTTAANRLPTAQGEVDAGRLAAAALTTGGGTLAPTDRLIDFYSSSTQYDTTVLLADNLPAGTHTVRIERTGYKRGVASASRIFSSGFAAAPYAATGSPTTTVHTIFPQGAAYSAYEYAIDLESADGTGHEFVGSVHGYDQQTSCQAWVDGQPVDLTTLADHSGREVLLIRESTLTSPHLTGTAATVRVAYRLTRDGLEVRTKITMAQACTMRAGYLAMYPLADALNRGVIVGVPGELDLSKGTGGASGGIRTRSQAALAYNAATGVAACMWLPDLSAVATWATSGTADGGIYIEDRTGNVINKIYAAITSPTVKRSLAAGEVLSSRVIYRVKQLPDVPAMIGR